MQTSVVTNLFQLILNLRYVHSETGVTHERFILFIDIFTDRSSIDLLKYVTQIVN